MSIDHILASITNVPLMITPDKLAVIMDVLGNRQTINLDIGSLASASPVPSVKAEARPASRVDQPGIGVISMVGSLVNREMPGSSGMTSYRGLTNQLNTLIADQRVGGIIIDADSNGGMGAGAGRAAKAIHAAAQIKPIYGFVDTNAFSAGYYLLAGCTKIILADNGSGVGSIGAFILHRDQSAHNEKEGYVYTAIYAGSEKIDFSPHNPLTEAMTAKLQHAVTTSRQVFAADVAAYRGLELSAVLATEAGCYHGRDAIAIGLADEVATLEETITMLTEEIRKVPSTKTTGGSEMTTKERLEALISKNEDAESSLTELGFVKAELAETVAKAAGHKEGLAAGLAQAKEIMDVATLGSVPMELAGSMIEKGMTQEEAMTAVQQHRANNSAGTGIHSTITPLSGDGKHPLLAAVEEQVAA